MFLILVDGRDIGMGVFSPRDDDFHEKMALFGTKKEAVTWFEESMFFGKVPFVIVDVDRYNDEWRYV
ncbi:hypothetical protein KAR91_09700 [Candidatus Pacearchaeota archaeon]|nr:hypothetical protein [Candidatus Pacearchaeota archaeon]